MNSPAEYVLHVLHPYELSIALQRLIYTHSQSTTSRYSSRRLAPSSYLSWFCPCGLIGAHVTLALWIPIGQKPRSLVSNGVLMARFISGSERRSARYGSRCSFLATFLR